MQTTICLVSALTITVVTDFVRLSSDPEGLCALSTVYVHAPQRVTFDTILYQMRLSAGSACLDDVVRKVDKTEKHSKRWITRLVNR